MRRGSWAVGVLAVLVFFNSLGNDFAYDDVHIIRDNQSIHSLETLPEALIQPYWPGDLGRALGLWRPLSTALYGLEWALWGDQAPAFHALNVLLHGVASVMVFRLLLLLLPFGGALVGGLIFAVHPVHVEAVANVVGRAEILSSIFYLAACLLFVRWRTAVGAVRILALCALFALAFLTKESAVTLPGALFLLDGTFRDRPLREIGAYLRERWLLYGGMAATAALILAGRQAVLGSLAHALAPFGAEALEEIPRIWTVAAAWPHYLRLLVFPLDLSIDYAPAVLPIAHRWTATGILGAVLALAILGVALWSWRAPAAGPGRTPPRPLGFGILWFVITISTVSNVLFLSGVLLAERTFYLPSVGFAACVGWIVSSVHVHRPRLAVILVVSAVGFMSVRTVTRNPVWSDNLTVFNSLLRDHPESARAQWVLGDVWFQRGQVSAALRAYRLAIGIAGAHYSLVTEIGRKFIDLGRPEDARRLLELAWKDKPQYATAPLLLSRVYTQAGEWDRVEEAVRAVLVIDPGDTSMLHLLANALGQQGRWAEAVEVRQAVIAGGEGDRWQQWFWLAGEEAEAGRLREARAALDQARARAPEGPATEQLDSLSAVLEGR